MSGAAGSPDETAAPSRPQSARARRTARPAAAGFSGAARRLTAGPWRWLGRRTLRGRLIAGLLALLAVGCALVGGATYFATSHFLTVQLDNQLQSSAGLYADACTRRPPPNGPQAGGQGGVPLPPGGGRPYPPPQPVPRGHHQQVRY